MVTDHKGNEFESIAEKCRFWGIKYHTYGERKKNGWSEEKALETPAKEKKGCLDHLGNMFPNEKEMCKYHNVSVATFHNRKSKGMSLGKCLESVKPRKIDLTGKRFGSLLVIEEAEKKGNTIMWKCKCDCGNYRIASSQTLRKGIVKSCGCIKKKTKDHSGERYGRLLLVKKTNKTNSSGSYIYVCRCDCGNITYKDIASLKNGGTSSCGCLKKEIEQEQIKRMRAINQVDGTVIGNITSKKIPSNNTTGYKGVYELKKGGIKQGIWVAHIRFKGQRYYLGRYYNIEDARMAREDAEKELYGNFLEWYAENYPEQWEKIKKKKND